MITLCIYPGPLPDMAFIFLPHSTAWKFSEFKTFLLSLTPKLLYRKSSIKRPPSNKRLPSIKRPPLEPFCTKRPSLISAPLLISASPLPTTEQLRRFPPKIRVMMRNNFPWFPARNLSWGRISWKQSDCCLFFAVVTLKNDRARIMHFFVTAC